MNTHATVRQTKRRDFLLDGGEDVLRLIRGLGDVYDNANSEREEAALKAHAAGRAAWWTTARYHNQSAVAVSIYANTHGLGMALATFGDANYPSVARHPAYLLGLMVPLNAEAVAERDEKLARMAAAVRRAG